MVKSIKKRLSFTLAIYLALIMFAAMPRTAAAGIGVPADLASGANLSGMRVYFGSYTGGASTGPIRWYVVATDAGTATLWTTTNMVNSQYSNTANHESWSGSPLCAWLNGTFFSSAFSAAERATVIDYGATEQANLDTVNTDPIQINQKIILPSVMEMNGTDGTGYGVGAWDIDYVTRASLNRWWWLRSPGEYDYRAAIVAANGEVMMHGSSVDSYFYAVHPAFKLDLSSVFFTSDASGANTKSSAAVGNGLMAATATSGPVKLTIQSASQKLTIASAPTTQTASAGGTLTYAYTGATTGKNQYVSCVLEQSGAVKYYGKLADCSSAAAASGTVTIPLAGVPAGSYTLKIFSEEANGDNLTDYAGAAVLIGLAINGPAPRPPSPLPTTGDGFPLVALLALLGVGLIAMAYLGARLYKQRKRG